jgi:epoxyqueuosine reductase
MSRMGRVAVETERVMAVDGRLLAGLRDAAERAGIELLGVTSAEPFAYEDDWWGHDQPRDLLPGARSVVVAGFRARYEPRTVPAEPGAPRGRFTPFGSRVFSQMEAHCWSVVGGYLRERGFAAVEAPRLPIKPALVRSGLGRYGRHGVVITPGFGSMIMFGGIVTDAPLVEPSGDLPVRAEVCPPDCRLCVDACPTGALAGDYRLDRSRCITNWLWGVLSPRDLREHQKTRLFGCAECLLACPLSRDVAPRRQYPVPTDGMDDCPELIPLAAGDRDHYERTVPTFPRQAGFETMRASAIVALGNLADPAAVETLAETLRSPDTRHRAYSAWALGRIGTERARQLVGEAASTETDATVRDEIEAALAAMS